LRRPLRYEQQEPVMPDARSSTGEEAERAAYVISRTKDRKLVGVKTTMVETQLK